MSGNMGEVRAHISSALEDEILTNYVSQTEGMSVHTVDHVAAMTALQCVSKQRSLERSDGKVLELNR